MSVPTTVLCLDDDELVLRSLARALSVAPELVIESTTSLDEGRARVLSGEPAVLVIDYDMPGQDGIVAIPRFRKLKPEAVIVMLTGFGDIPLTVAAMREGADTLLTKPVDVDRLLREAAAVPMPDREPPPSRPGAASSSRTYRLEDVERETIEAALHNAGGVVATAAKMLGIDRRTLQRKLKRIGG